jgi:hypothetical protein
MGAREVTHAKMILRKYIEDKNNNEPITHVYAFKLSYQLFNW